MKFSVFFTSSGLRILSVLGGILSGSALAFIFDWKIGVLTGAITALVLSLALPLIFYIRFLPYERLKRTLKEPFLFDVPVRFTVKTGTVGGFFVLTERSMIFLSLECETRTMELTRDKIARICRGKDLNLDIYLNNTQFIRVFSGACEELIAILREHGWTVTE